MGLELEELRREQAGYEQQIQAVDEATAAIQEQIDNMACTVSQNKVGGLDLPLSPSTRSVRLFHPNSAGFFLVCRRLCRKPRKSWPSRRRSSWPRTQSSR